MTVRKRLFWSNLLMILVPVIATALIGILCVGILWTSLLHGADFGAEDSEEFTYASMAISELVEKELEEGEGEDLSSLESLLDGNGMRLTVLREGEVAFNYGKSSERDRELLNAVRSLDDEATITQNGRSLYIHAKSTEASNYLICLFGGNNNQQGYHDLKTVLALSALLIAITILLSILFTNRFLIRFVFKKIEEPLDILRDGVGQLRDGNLDYRIEYTREDEFLPVCDDFNEMAVRLKQSVEQERQQEKSRKELIAGISHDIRSPLTSIQAYVEGLIDGIAKTPEKQQLYLHTIKNKAEDLEHILSQLFLFSKMEMGEYPENFRRIRLDEQIREIVRDMQEEYQEKGLNISMELEPAEIDADPVQIQRVMINILENSVKYKEKEEGRAFICLSRAEKGYRLTIGDDGPGVPEEAVAHLFEVFYRSDPARQNPSKGSGLGLAIVANAVKRMGGTIQARNRKEGGLEICIDLPAGGKDDGENTDH